MHALCSLIVLTSSRQTEATCAKLKTDPENGLSNAEVIERRKIHGRNELEAAPPKSLLALVLEQFEDMLVIILLAAAALSFVLACFEEHKEGEVCRNYCYFNCEKSRVYTLK